MATQSIGSLADSPIIMQQMGTAPVQLVGTVGNSWFSISQASATQLVGTIGNIPFIINSAGVPALFTALQGLL